MMSYRRFVVKYFFYVVFDEFIYYFEFGVVCDLMNCCFDFFYWCFGFINCDCRV